MSDCCGSRTDEARCPDCDRAGKGVDAVTLLHRVAAPLNRQLPPGPFFFCNNPACPVVYFSEAGARIALDQVRGEVGQKASGRDRPLCYCFDLSYGAVLDELAEAGQSAAKAFVVEQTRLKRCACEIRNPSGRCCLGDFPR